MPVAASKLKHEVEIAGISITFFSPSRMIEPFPNCFSILAIAKSIARFRSLRSSAIKLVFPFYLRVNLKINYTISRDGLLSHLSETLGSKHSPKIKTGHRNHPVPLGPPQVVIGKQG